VLALLSLNAPAQVDVVNALKQKLQSAPSDSVKCRILNELTEVASDDEWPGFNAQMKKVSSENLKHCAKGDKEYFIFKRYYANAVNNDGFILQSQGRLKEATDLFRDNLKVQEEIGDKVGLAVSISNIGALYEQQGQMKKALEYYDRALKMSEAVGDKRNTAHLFNNISNVYYALRQINEGFDALQKALKLYKEIDDKHGISMTLSNIGSFHDYQLEFDTALTYLKAALKIKEEIGDFEGAALTLSNLGITYRKMKQFDKAMEAGMRAYSLNEKYGSKHNIAISLVFVAKTYLEMSAQLKNPDKAKLLKAIEYGEKSLALSKELNYAHGIDEASHTLSDIYTALGQYEKALENYELYIQTIDSINNVESRKAGIKSQLKYEYEKQAIADSIAHVKENDIKNAELEKQTAEIKEKRILQYVMFGGLTLVLVFAGFMYNRFKITQKQKLIIETKEKETKKQNEIISEQKRQVEEKQKEILDSINYAKRIQIALITSERYILKNLNRLKGSS
jgi:tetratricopeptide (TPR) repeat protein